MKQMITNNSIIRVTCTDNRNPLSPSYMVENTASVKEHIVLEQKEQQELVYQTKDKTLLEQISWELTKRDITQYVIEGDQTKITMKQTIDGERAFIENASTKKIGEAYTGKLSFRISPNEAIYGLGQQEQGIFNYRNTKEYLYQNNMQIPMPFFLSSRGYGILLDANCLMTYEESDNIITIELDAVDQLDYYVITGEKFDQIICSLRELTGQALMLPKWAFGYVQSKERYKTQQELIETADHFKQLGIPLSCLVQDWLSWEDGKWGNKLVDKSRFPDLKGMVEALHERGVAFMISIWPNVSEGCEDNAELMEAGKLMANLNTYNAFDKGATDLYWKQCERELFAAGTDAWWCDSTEPFTPDWNGEEKKEDLERYELAKDSLTKYMDARNANAFALFHAKGIFEHQTAIDRSKRVVNLTRSGSLSIQKYGVILWSGDIKATWEVLKNQIAEGLSICACGIPYWTLDIGAFFAGATKAFRKGCNNPELNAPWFWQGDYEEGVDDLGYRELYTRWLQFGTFLPMMRSHGTDTPREPWNFGEPGTLYYDTIVDFIKLRYRLLPYIYSLAAKVCREGYTMMRSLMFDFFQDTKVLEMKDSYMFGNAFLVSPVTEAMEYGKENTKLHGRMTKEVYLPAGADWFDFWDDTFINGGQVIEAAAPINSVY